MREATRREAEIRKNTRLLKQRNRRRMLEADMKAVAFSDNDIAVVAWTFGGRS
jgi:hypothetical protein